MKVRPSFKPTRGGNKRKLDVSRQPTPRYERLNLITIRERHIEFPASSSSRLSVCVPTKHVVIHTKILRIQTCQKKQSNPLCHGIKQELEAGPATAFKFQPLSSRNLPEGQFYEPIQASSRYSKRRKDLRIRLPGPLHFEHGCFVIGQLELFGIRHTSTNSGLLCSERHRCTHKRCATYARYKPANAEG